MNVSCSTETLNQINQSVVNNQTGQNIAILVIFVLFVLGYGIFIFYFGASAFKNLIDRYYFLRARKEFYKYALILIRTNSDTSDLHPLIRNITDLYKHNLKRSELDPNFINTLVATLELLKTVLLKENLENCTNSDVEDETNHYLDQINQIISIIKQENPFSGLNEDELSFFNQFQTDIDKGDKEILKGKLTVLSKMLKKKNGEIKNLDETAKTANRISIIGAVIGIVSIIVAIVLWLLSLK